MRPCPADSPSLWTFRESWQRHAFLSGSKELVGERERFVRIRRAHDGIALAVHTADKTLQLDGQWLTMRDRIPDRGPLADASQGVESIPSTGSFAIFVPQKLLRQVVDPENTELTCDRQHAGFCRGEPVHVEACYDRPVSERGDERILMVRVHVSSGLSVDRIRASAKQVVQNI